MPTTLNDITSTDWSLSLETPDKVVQGLDDIRQCIYLILVTVRGQDPLRPLFGCGVLEKLDRPVNETIPEMIRDILEAVALWEPRVEILEITHTLDVAAVTFSINFRVLNTEQTGQIDVTYGLNSAA